MPTRPPAVLLTNGQLRKTLSAARSLGGKGVPVYVADTSRLHPAGMSKFVGKRLRYPDPREHPGPFADWLERTVREEGIGVLFPMDDDTMDAVMSQRERFERLCAIPLPPSDSYAKAADKGTAARLAREAGAGCPWTLEPASAEEVERLSASLPYPAVVKPRRSSGSRGIRVARGAGELNRLYAEVDGSYPLPVIQQYIAPGVRYDVCLLYGPDGRLLASFVQKELRHFPLERGPSTAQESVHWPELVRTAAAIMEPLAWKGIAEVEFMVDPATGTPMFMEINTRFWNSLHMAVIAGVDFPWLLYRSATGGMPDPVHDYESGRRCRSLLPGDLLHFAASRGRLRMDPPLWAGRRHNVEDDIWSAEDPLPALGAMLACARYALDPAMWKLLFAR